MHEYIDLPPLFSQSMKININQENIAQIFKLTGIQM